MRILFSALVIATIVVSCQSTSSDKSESDENSIVNVLIEPLPGKVGFVSIVELRVEHWEDIPPDFYVVHNNDTGLLDYSYEKNCSKLELIYHKPGKYNFEGFVDYYNPDSLKSRTNYNFEYIVEE